MNVGVLYVLAVSSLGVYGIIMAGWASNSKYAFLGAIRSSAQMISYEVSMGLVIVTVLLVTGSLNLSEIVEHQRDMPFWIHLLLAPVAVVFFISVLAETNRLPFDLPEAESELVAGYNVEYSSMSFALFFLGEYANMILVSAMTVTFFMGGYLPPFGISFLYLIPGFIWFILKICFLLFVFLWIRATLPRYRYDQLMHLGWKVFLPLTLFWVVLTQGIARLLRAYLMGLLFTTPLVTKRLVLIPSGKLVMVSMCLAQIRWSVIMETQPRLVFTHLQTLMLT
jgi:NADH-quinone oxidoreductase subunit H